MSLLTFNKGSDLDGQKVARRDFKVPNRILNVKCKTECRGDEEEASPPPSAPCIIIIVAFVFMHQSFFCSEMNLRSRSCDASAGNQHHPADPPPHPTPHHVSQHTGDGYLPPSVAGCPSGGA